MSTFSGLFDEFPYISADRFDGENLNSKLFFLSHCHMDHMIGLNNYNGLPGPLYTSAVSKVLVQKQFPNVKDIRVLDIESPEELCFQVNGIDFRVVVTALPARHCPGSVMFLFQSSEHKVLYTGDFRLTKRDLEKHFSSLRNIEPDTVYLDSTFLNKNYMYFPTQTDSISVICELISEWTSKSKQHKVIIRIPAQYGSEFLFTEIGRKLKQKICFSNRQFEKYIYFPDMDHCISTYPDECQIFSNQLHEKMKIPYALCRTIQPSAIFWRNWKPSCPIFRMMNPGYFRVAYSSHSSYDEIKEFINFIKPKNVKLNVDSVDNRDKMRECVNEILNEAKELDKCTEQIVTKCNFSNLMKLTKDRVICKEASLKMPAKRVKL